MNASGLPALAASTGVGVQAVPSDCLPHRGHLSVVDDVDAPAGDVPNPVKGAVTKRISLPPTLRREKASDCISPTSRPWSTVRFRVAASTKEASRAGFISVSAERPLSISALRKACWRRPREMSPSLS